VVGDRHIACADLVCFVARRAILNWRGKVATSSSKSDADSRGDVDLFWRIGKPPFLNRAHFSDEDNWPEAE